MGFIMGVPLSHLGSEYFPWTIKERGRIFYHYSSVASEGLLHVAPGSNLFPETHPDSDVVPDSIHPVRYPILFQAVQGRIFKGMKNICVTPAASHEVHSYQKYCE